MSAAPIPLADVEVKPHSSHEVYSQSDVAVQDSATNPTKSCCRSICCSDLRLWTVLHAVLTACMMAFLVGITLTYSSPVLLELTQLRDPQFRFDTGLADLFGVK